MNKGVYHETIAQALSASPPGSRQDKTKMAVSQRTALFHALRLVLYSRSRVISHCLSRNLTSVRELFS